MDLPSLNAHIYRAHPVLVIPIGGIAAEVHKQLGNLLKGSA